MNLVLIRECSNSCPYCFETEERHTGKQGQISMENVTVFAKWARSTRLGYLSLLGGEPFLHPKLPTIVQILRQTAPGTALRLLTGGVFNKDILDTLPPQEVSLVFNINEPRDYKNPKHFNKVLNNVETAIRKGFKVGIGFNVWRMDFNTSFMPNLAHRFGLSNFSWTVANPIRGCPSKVVLPNRFGELSGRCFEMLQEAARLGIEARLDCPLPLCFFNDSELAWVRQYHPTTASGLGFCEPVLDVTPELEVIRCFALSSLTRLKLVDFHSEKEIEDWFLRHLDTRLLNGGCYSDCQECEHHKKGRCYGGCLACHDGEVDIERRSRATVLEWDMNAAVEAGKPELALELFEKANFWAKTDLATFAAAVAASRLGDWNGAFLRASEANNRAHDPDFMRMIGEFITQIVGPNIKTTPMAPDKIGNTDFVRCHSAKDEGSPSDN